MTTLPNTNSSGTSLLTKQEQKNLALLSEAVALKQKRQSLKSRLLKLAEKPGNDIGEW